MGFSWTTFYFFEGGLLTVDLGRRKFRFVGFDAGRPLVSGTSFWLESGDFGLSLNKW